MFLSAEDDVDSDQGDDVGQEVTSDEDSIMSKRASSFFKGMVIINSEWSDQELALRQRADHDAPQDTLMGDLSSSDSSSDDETSWMSPSPEAIVHTHH
ncbi:hypothetical protein BHE90_016990 [Fusarium euwallaceae]|uniref:Uncharacterized protein n=4 Tax=Fusarium solani species complex TaxID=232080 RepID=A0A3M2SRM1_9HYPO|nr:hypothetical protein CDV36_000140 [Fusarium kuroshium]RSL64394.1 hypothetical protein CEP51_013154 [Fusarium floridanum]RSL91267.1 hypothetical protein CDV31_015497 [Fusarium ambrosium]RTE68633.1 hypothetical protein BHE90_016990 [Fusarium euwallaceae]